MEKLRESVKKPRPNRDAELAELAALEPLQTALEEGKSLRETRSVGRPEESDPVFSTL